MSTKNPPLGPPDPSKIKNLKRKWPTVKVETKAETEQTTSNNIPTAPPTSSYSYMEKKYEKRSTNYSGLGNQGATCYLNSLLQALYHTPEFRNMIYHFHYNSEKHGKETSCIPLQFQRLFAYMEKSYRRDQKTKDITVSFGWESRESFTQHDVQELMRVLFDALDKTFSGNEKNQPVSELYKGIMYDYIKTRNTEKLIERIQEAIYLDIQLVIRDVKSIEEALDNYVKPEILEGDCQWRCEALDNKMVDAEKGFQFKTLPYILTLQLKRFDYDPITWNRVKLSNYVSFPFELDMSKYVNEEKQIYELFSVLIHAGSENSGHYFAYIKSFENGKWYNFNDDNVTEIQEEKIKEMYGGKEDVKSYGSRQWKISTNAYMLLYRKKDEKLNLNVCDWDLLPDFIKKEVEKDNLLFEQEREDYLKSKNLIQLRVYYDNCEVPETVKVEKSKNILEATEEIYKHFKTLKNDLKYDLKDIRIRNYNILDKTPGRSFVGKQMKTLDQLGFLSCHSVYLEYKESDKEWPNIIDNYNIAVFPIDPETNQVENIKIIKIDVDSTLKSAKKQISEALGDKYPEDQLILVKYTMTENILIEGDDKLFENELYVKENNIIYLESCPKDQKSKIFEIMEGLKHSYHLYFNTIGSDESNKQVIIDSRKTLGDLKLEISKILEIPIDSFTMTKKLSKFTYRDMSKIIKESDLFDNSQLTIELGQDLKENEANIKLYLYVPYEEEGDELKNENDDLITSKIDVNSEKTKNKFLKMREQFTLIGNIIVDQDMKLSEWKKTLSEKFNTEPSRIRLRLKNGLILTKPIFKDEKLKDVIPSLSNGRDIAITLLDEAEQLEDDDLIIRVQKWYPNEWKFDPKKEIVINKIKHKTSKSLKKRLSELFKMNEEDISIAKPPLAFEYWQNPACGDIVVLNWESDTQNITAPPLSIDDGVLILFKNNKEKEKVPPEELEKLGFTQKKEEREQALKIWTIYDKKEEN